MLAEITTKAGRTFFGMGPWLDLAGVSLLMLGGFAYLGWIAYYSLSSARRMGSVKIGPDYGEPSDEGYKGPYCAG